MRTDPSLAFEKDLWHGGFRHIAGLDEAGRGALAGPVAVGAVILPNDLHLLPAPRSRKSAPLSGVRDSKQMTPLERESAAVRIKQLALAWSVAFASSEEIDSDGIVRATRLAALRALQDLSLWPEYLLTDFRLELPAARYSQTSLVKGDALCLSIAAASVLGEDSPRCPACARWTCRFPATGWGNTKATARLAHRLALEQLGYSPIHRKTFILKRH